MIVVPDEGERYLLKLLLKDTVPPDLVFRIGLFRNDWTPKRDSVLADVLEANFSGYMPKELARTVWTIPATVTGAAQSTYGALLLDWVAASGTQQIFGYYVRDQDSNVLLWAEQFSVPILISAATHVQLLPVMRLHSEYEPA